MKRIAVDFDGVLFPTVEKTLEIYNKKHGTFLDISQIITYSLHDNFDASIADELTELFIDKNTYDSLQPYKGAVKAIKNLIEQGNEVYVATATDVRNMEWKEELLQKYFPFIPKKNLIRIYDKSLLRIDVLIEDNIDTLKSMVVDRICFNQPWNQNEETDWLYDIYRIHHWDEITNVIKTIERKEKKWEG